MINNRTAYLLTGDVNSERAIFSKDILDKIGFDVNIIIYTPNENRVVSNKLSMYHILELIISSKDLGENEFVYFFEDDINVLEPITIDEIIEYEKFTDIFFYLGICEHKAYATPTNLKINNYTVFQKQGNVRGTHAFGISKNGAKKLLEFSKQFELDKYMDMILEDFSVLYPANVVRYDLCSTIWGHRGIIFQDRTKFQSIMNT
jgi:GR25 family glycosyltransferase involved in LPS biosynthesis